MSSKVIVTNKSALVAKYGKRGFEMVEKAIDSLIIADQTRFITDTIVYVDDVEQMALYQATSVTNPVDDKQNKDAIDAICIALNPSYLAIIGAQDVIPMQLLENLADKNDFNVPSDLPYACSASYSTDISNFLSPTRVVGRMPGVPHAHSPKALIAALNTSISMKGLERKNYDSYFAVSAEIWERSSKQSITNIMGDFKNLHFTPPEGPNWTDKQLLSRIHFVNCHGASNNPNWYGQRGGGYPIAVEASKVDNKIIPNTIGAAECCYGGQLYNPGGVCTSYLNSGIASFCGSTTIAYGPAVGQGSADLITQYFLIDLLATSSAGSAMLTARQKYINEHKPMSVFDLKTIAQFNLLGDPSAHPVIPDATTDANVLMEKSMLRNEKRIAFDSFGEHLSNTVSFASKCVSEEILEEVVAEANKVFKNIKSKRVYEISEGPLLKQLSKKFNNTVTHIHIVDEEQEEEFEPGLRKEQNLFLHRVLIAKEIGGKIVSYQLLNSK